MDMLVHVEAKEEKCGAKRIIGTGTGHLGV